MGQGETGTWFFFIGLTGAIGTFLGGYLGDRFGRDDARWYMWIPGLSTVCAIPLSAGLYLWPEGEQALYFAFPAVIFGAMYLGPTFAITQAIVKVRMRAVLATVTVKKPL